MDINADTLFQLATFYKVFSDETRLKILMVMESNELSVQIIAHKLSMTSSAISHQLRVLRQLNLVKSRKSGKEVFYSLADDHIKIILSYGLEHIYEGGRGNEKI